MFSSFSNMLPNLSLPGQDREQQTPTNNPSTNPFDRLLAVKRRFDGLRTPVPPSEETQAVEARPSQTETETETDHEQETEAERVAVLEKERKKKPLNETFVVVRPPPSVSNHPLNLQLQLIPPSVNQIQQTARSASTSTMASTSSAGGGYNATGGVPNVPPVSAGLQSKKEAMRQVAEPVPDEELTRVRTNRSDLSGFYSSIGSSASVQSFATMTSTSTSTGSSARRIIPLYNLSAHNVLQNTVQDAGTDATVSRFRKRGIDIVGLGVLEPVEVWGNAPLGGAGGYSVEACGVPVSGLDAASDTGHGASSIGHGSEEYSPPGRTAHLREASLPVDQTPPSTPTLGVPKESGPKKLFGKLFSKKKEPSGSSAGSGSGFSAGATLSPPAQPRTSFGSSSRSRPTSIYSVVPPTPVPATPTTAVVPPTPTAATTSTYLQPPVLGTQASLRAESYPPHGRATAYVWVLRRWTKGGGVFAGLAGAMGVSGANGVDVSRLGVEVRFEWVRGKKRRRAGDENKTVGVGRRKGAGGGGSRPVSVADRPVSTFSVGDGPDFSALGGGESLGVPAAGSRASARSGSPSPRRSGESKPRSRRDSSPTKPRGAAVGRTDSSGSSRERSVEDEDEDSEPEDSETPWSCTLRILPLDSADTPTPTIGAPASEPVSQPGGMKLRLAHLVPAPHHPKVIGQFKMPFPLPDVSVQRMELLPRAPGDSFGLGGAGAGRNEVVMSAEEIKDVVCTTGLWLMVREGFGGLGGKKRKGDGWKIRS